LRGDEKGEAQVFLERLFRALGHEGVFEAGATLEERVTGRDRSGTAFAGLHPRKAAVLMTIRTDAPIKSARIRKSEQASRNRYHHDLLVASPEEVDAELVAWLKAAHRLAAASTLRIIKA